LNKNKKTIS